MAESLAATPYAEVNAVLRHFLAETTSILGDHFVGLYLSGSLALGDFDPRNSDIDLIVVTTATLSDDRVDALGAMHAQFAAGASPWAHKIEAVYIPREAFQRGPPPCARYPVLEKDTPFALAPLEDGWPVQAYTLREHGIAVVGPEPRTFIPPVDPAEMNRAGFGIAVQWREQAHTDP